MSHKGLAIAAIAITALVFFSSFKNEENTLYSEWKKNYEVTWDSSEDAYRRIIFERNVEIINKHNSDPSQTYKMGINQFTAMTDEEFQNTYLDLESYKNKISV